MEFGAVILSGGKSSRFGRDKGLYHLNQKYMVEYAIDLALEFTSELIISANQEDYEQFGYPVIRDTYPDLGPMGGLYSAINASKLDINLILPCDSPFISKELIQKLIIAYNNEEVMIFKTSDGKRHPLIGFYHKNILKNLLEHIENKKLKLIDFISTTQHKIIEIEEQNPLNKCFQNFNYEKDITNIVNQEMKKQ